MVSFDSYYRYWRELHDEDCERYEAEKQHVAEQVLDRLEERFPGLAGQVEAIDVATPLTTERYTGNWQGSVEGWMITTRTMKMMFGRGMGKTLPGWTACTWQASGSSPAAACRPRPVRAQSNPDALHAVPENPLRQPFLKARLPLSPEANASPGHRLRRRIAADDLHLRHRSGIRSRVTMYPTFTNYRRQQMREKSIELLNRAVGDELAAVHQYMYFHFHLDDQGYDLLSGLFKRTGHPGNGSCRTPGRTHPVPEGRRDHESCRRRIAGPGCGRDARDGCKMEEGSVRDYNLWANECSANADSISKKIFEQLVAEEEVHYTQFDNELDKVRKFGEHIWLCSRSSAARAWPQPHRRPANEIRSATVGAFALLTAESRDPLLTGCSPGITAGAGQQYARRRFVALHKRAQWLAKPFYH